MVRKVETVLQQGHTLYIHCPNGISRGAMLIAAYLMKKNSQDRETALAFLQERRPGVRPNPVFMDLLKKWEDHRGKPFP